MYGDNSSDLGPPAGQDYGTFDLFSDNEWIASQIAALPNGVLRSGDVTRDGAINQADVTAFVAGWDRKKEFQGSVNRLYVGDWETWGWGDLNLDGRVNLTDAVILDENLVVNGVAAGLDFSLLNGAAVPEPGAFASCLLLTLTGLVLRKKKAA
ncbi:MAG: hypothetical protein KDA37_14110, partial [Planctomycetales bacterium]|nr:hypothetical protein [Planctomycetales bacterium]